VKIRGNPAKIMINLGATGNYILSRYVAQHRLETREKKHAYKLALADGKPMRQDEE
jgi:hypothetical protein